MRFCFLLLCILGSTALFSQDRMLSGSVKGSDLDDVLIGASVVVKGTTIGSVTDLDGNYSLKLPEDADTVVVSYLGYKDAIQAINGRAQINFVLSPDLELMDEVVVIGYGVQKKRLSTGSIGSLDSENLEGIQVQNVQSALEGQISGLIVSESSGQPGAGKSILIRGISTNGDNTPLYVVDGLQVSGIDNINPSDIESVDVLKDAASCAIYGARGANGVIIVTTKKGSDIEGEISYEAFTSASQPWKLPEMLGADDYVLLTREKFQNGGQLTALNGLGFPQIGDPTPNTNWMDAVFNDATVQSHRLSATKKGLYMSMEYWDEGGVVGGDESGYKRYAIRLNGNKEINDWITVGENIYINRTDVKSIGVNNAFGTVIVDAFAYDPITEIYNDDKQYGFEQSEWVQKEYVNPLSRLFLSNGSGHADQIVGNVFADIKPHKNLRFHTDAGIDYGWFKYRAFTPDYNYHPAYVNVTNDVAQGYGFGQSYQFENYLNYTTELGQHNFDFIVGTSYREENGEGAGGNSSSIPFEVQFNPNFQILDAGQDTTDLAGGGIGVPYRLISYYGRLIYNYNDKYLFSSTLRRDGSSNFGEANRFGIFPSFSAGWVVSKEPFFNTNRISFLKLRASWGVNGNDRIAPLTYAARVENVFTYPFGVDQSLITGAALSTPPNPNIKWEESIQLDLGLEIRLWDDKLSAEVDYYQKTTSDLLMNQVIPGYIGATNQPISNLGEIRNTGVEAAVNYKTHIGQLKIQTSVNYTTFENTVVNVAGDSGFISGWGWPVRNTPITRMSEGFPVGHFVGYQADGIFQSEAEIFSHVSATGEVLQPKASPGDLKFLDVNGDGLIDTDDITNIGSPWSDHIIGATLSAQFKGFDMSAILSAQLGHDIYRTYERSDITYSNYQSIWLDRWTPENTDAEFPRLVSNDPNNNQRPSSFYVEDGSFVRLRNFQIGYTFPSAWMDKAQIKKLRLYVSINNLFTITNYRGFDPEIGTSGWILDTGIDKGYYPLNKTIGFGARLTL